MLVGEWELWSFLSCEIFMKLAMKNAKIKSFKFQKLGLVFAKALITIKQQITIKNFGNNLEKYFLCAPTKSFSLFFLSLASSLYAQFFY